MPCSHEVKKFVNGFYTHAAAHCSGLDVRVLLSNISNVTDLKLGQHQLHRKYAVSLFDCPAEEDVTTLLNYVKVNFPQESNEISTVRVLEDAKEHGNSEEGVPSASEGANFFSCVLFPSYEQS